MRRYSAIIVTVWLVSLAWSQEKPKTPEELAKLPPHQRMLKGQDAKTAEELEQNYNEYMNAEDWAEAKRYAQALLDLRIQKQGPDHYEVINARQMLKDVEIQAKLTPEQRRQWTESREFNQKAYQLLQQGRYREAQPLYQKALAIRLKVLGEEHPDTAQSYNNLAMNLQAQGKAAEVQPLYQKALAIYRKVLGEEHPHTASSYNNLGLNLQDQGKAAEAQPLLQKALAIRLKLLGEEHPDTARSYANLASNLAAQGKAAEAQPLLQKALAIHRKVLGEEHPDTATSYNNLAGNLKAQGKAAEAQPLYQKALAIRLKLLGEEHPATATSYNNLGLNLQDQGKAAEAQPLYQKALAIRLKLLGEEHPHTATSYNNLGLNLQAQGKAAEAQPLYQKALAIRLKLLGEEHPATALSYNALAYNLAAQGKAAEAQPLLQKALAICRKVLGEEHPATATSYANLAYNLAAQGKAAEAQPLYQKALAIRLKLLGEEHPDTANSYNNLAYNLAAQGKAAEAQPLYQKALAIRLKLLGEEHPDTAQSYNNLAYNLNAQGKAAEAATLLKQAIFCFEASRLARARGIERAIGEEFNPRRLLAAIEQATNPAAAWEQVEASLARGLLDQQAAGRSTLTAEEQKQQAAWQQQMDQLQPRILAMVSVPKRTAEQQRELDDLSTQRNNISRQLAELAVMQSQRELARPETIQAALSPDAALLLWVDAATPDGGVEEHWACVVRRDGPPHWAKLPGTGHNGKWTKEDATLPSRFREAIIEQRDVTELTQQLRRQRLEPVLKHLNGISTLFVVGVNWMAGIPVEVLAPEFAVGYVPSGSFLARQPQKPTFSNTLFAVGDPIYQLKTAEPKAQTVLPPHGLLLQDVQRNGAAWNAGLRPGDVLLSYGDTKLEKLDQLRPAMQKLVADKVQEVELTYWFVDEKNQPAEKKVKLPVGPLGVALERDPAPQALANRRQTEAMFASLRAGEQWLDLPGTRYEVSRIAELFPSGKVLLDGNANERAVDQLRQSGELAQFRYLHFATHGKGDNKTAFESKLILSQDGKKDDVSQPGQPWYNNEISAREVLEFWKLNADLVTLSACQTSYGKQGGGDGLLGFAQAFLLSGARTVCLSLWEVDDTATALLMQRFYQNLLGKRDGLKGPMPKLKALNEAKAWLRNLTSEEAFKASAALRQSVTRGTRGEVTIKKLDRLAPKPYEHPQFWSGFILFGEAE